MPKLAIIHTTTATVDSLRALAGEIIPGCEVINFVDDSILPQLANSGGDLATVEERLVHYARFAESAGAEVVLEACSSVGDVVPKMQQAVTIPVVRIDDAMAEAAIRRGNHLGVAATLPTTLGPTTRLLQDKAAAAGKIVQVRPLLIEGAFQKLSSGDREGHDALLVEGLSDLAGSVDVVVLAQASMARVLPQLPPSYQEKILSSPRSGMERVRTVLG